MSRTNVHKIFRFGDIRKNLMFKDKKNYKVGKEIHLFRKYAKKYWFAIQDINMATDLRVQNEN